MDCTYCGSDVADHSPVYVIEDLSSCGAPPDAFCNYSCLVSHVEEEGLTCGDACEIELG